MSIDIQYLHINKKEELLPFKEEILNLFYECFDRKFDEKLWTWLYLENPLNYPIVNLAFLNRKLVGHYAFIPLKTNLYNVFLSVTTMVAKNARKHDVFCSLATKSYDFARDLNCDIIIGFPNKTAVIVHKVLLDWQIEDTFIASVNNYHLEHKEEMIYLDTKDLEFMHWRLSKPNVSYITKPNGLIMKKYEDSLDIMHFEKATFLEKTDCLYNVLTQDQALKNQKSIDYPFGYKVLNPLIQNPSFRIELLMSDVF
ncbi:hypothetical protein BBW65_03990 [Helicobacter enhydrae]|uniref:GNAT family N-acetyltransferase n=1 Tax=Helicobacter enhydrae TaxID=222136 RepID=A0A1B1U5L1_9HELI|nr:GNAT family N-acetyltransferase [Helicobacter enhydrae]ANV98011.1 hypothetical protein BBW65_03990 [Helicobacter enhydrae]